MQEKGMVCVPTRVKQLYSESEIAFDIIKRMYDFTYRFIDNTMKETEIDYNLMKKESADIIGDIGELMGFNKDSDAPKSTALINRSRFYYIIYDMVKPKEENKHSFWNWCYKVVANFSIGEINKYNLSKDKLIEGFLRGCDVTGEEYSQLILVEDDIEPWLNEIKEYFSLISYVLHTTNLDSSSKKYLKRCRDSILDCIREKNYSLTGFLIYNTTPK